MTKIKICGITNVKDALACANLGVDVLGFIFAESPRRVSSAKAKEIISRLPPFVLRVGVFVNEKAAIVNKIVKLCGLDIAQLHGDESPAYCKKIKARVIKAFRIKDGGSLAGIQKYEGKISAILLDTFSKDKYGGTGKAFNWSIALQAKKFDMPVILSGGLNPGNILGAIKKAVPYAVDFCSGVESREGIKNIRKAARAVEITRKTAV